MARGAVVWEAVALVPRWEEGGVCVPARREGSSLATVWGVWKTWATGGEGYGGLNGWMFRWVFLDVVGLGGIWNDGRAYHSNQG